MQRGSEYGFRANGLLVDCCRVMERHSYYFSLLDFMADWGMNALLLHFTDDHGCGISLPGFEDIAMRHAFSQAEVRELVEYAKARGVDIIPELETFGHTRYLTDNPRYKHLSAVKNTNKLLFNAVDPMNPETLEIVHQLIHAVAALFPSEYLHIGCDEVNLKQCCGLDEAPIWAEYVNRVIDLVKAEGRTPLLWADHLVKSEEIRLAISKDAVPVQWDYEEQINREALQTLREAGFERIILAPSIACYRHRFLPTSSALKNTDDMVGYGLEHHADGVINAVWCPQRYIQGAMYYGIAHSACVTSNGGLFNSSEFNTNFARCIFGTELIPELSEFLDLWPQLHIDHLMAGKFLRRKAKMSRQERERLIRMNEIGRRVLMLAELYKPSKGKDIWGDMVLAAKCAWLCTEAWVLAQTPDSSPQRREAYEDLLRTVCLELDESWDRGRYSDDPTRYTPKFANEKSESAISLIRELPLSPWQSGLT